MFSYIDWYVSVSSLTIYHWFPFFAHFDVIAFEFHVRSAPWHLIIDFSRVKLIKIQLKPNISVDSTALKSHSVKNWNFAGKKFSPLEERCFHNIAGDSAHCAGGSESKRWEDVQLIHERDVLVLHEKWKHSLRRLYIQRTFFIIAQVELSIVWQCTTRLLVNLFTCFLYFYCASFCSVKLYNCAS